MNESPGRILLERPPVSDTQTKKVWTSLQQFLALHRGTAWFFMLVLVLAIFSYAFSLKLLFDLKPSTCEALRDDDQNRKVSHALKIINVIAIMLTGVAAVVLAFHIFFPIHK
jgi:hypothetical protein